jgi:hypothetical protein
MTPFLLLLAGLALLALERCRKKKRGKPKATKGESLSLGVIIALIVCTAVGLYIATSMIPPAFDTFYSQETEGWGFVNNPNEYRYNQTTEIWEFYNGTAWIETTSREDTKNTRIWEMYPMLGAVVALLVFVGIVIVILR